MKIELNDKAAFAIGVLAYFAFMLALALMAGCSQLQNLQRSSQVELIAFSKPDSICAAVVVRDSTAGFSVGYGPRCFYLWDIFGQNTVIFTTMDSTAGERIVTGDGE